MPCHVGTVCSVIVQTAIEAEGGQAIGTGMKRARKLANLAGTVLPLVGLVVAIALLWNRMVGPRELVILFVGYVLAGVGITVGYHRLFTHRSFQTYRWVRYAFAVLGQCAVEGNVVSWVANHRKHHQFADQSGDPHSPHAGYGEGVRQTIKGLWHAHTGWLFDDDANAERGRYAKDLVDDMGLKVIAGLFVPIVLLSLAIPGLVGWAVDRRPLRLPRRSRVGWRGSHLAPSPRDLVDQFDLPLRDGSDSHRLTSPVTSGGFRGFPSASPGITTTTPFPPPRSTVCAVSKSTPAAGLSGCSNAAGSPGGLSGFHPRSKR